MNQTDTIHFIKPLIRSQKNIIYNDTKYPIDFDVLKKNSNYFYNNRKYYKNTNEIELQTEQINITNEVFQTFISCCQNQSFQINDINVIPLHRLSIRYEVPELIQLTKEFISKNSKKLIIQTILFKLQIFDEPDSYSDDLMRTTDTSEEEKLISSEILEYINDDQLLLLPIRILYRILNNDKLNLKEMAETDQNKVVDFMFKCLDKYKKEASILFINLDIENNRTDVLKKLLNQYSDVFDFNMINPKLMAQTTSSLLSEIAKLKAYYSDQIQEMNKSIENQNKKLIKQEEIIDTFKKETSEIINKSVNKCKQEIFEFIKQQNNKQNNEFSKQQNTLQNKQNTLLYQQNTFQSKQNSIQSKQNEIINQQNAFQSKQDEIIDQQNAFQEKIKEQEEKIEKQSDSLSQQEKLIQSNNELIKSNYKQVTDDIKNMKEKLESSLSEKSSEQNKKNEEILKMLNQLNQKITNELKCTNNQRNQKERLEIDPIKAKYQKPNGLYLSSSSDDENFYSKIFHGKPLSIPKFSDTDDEDDNGSLSARSYIEEPKFDSSSYLYASKNVNRRYDDSMFESDDPHISRKVKVNVKYDNFPPPLRNIDPNTRNQYNNSNEVKRHKLPSKKHSLSNKRHNYS